MQARVGRKILVLAPLHAVQLPDSGGCTPPSLNRETDSRVPGIILPNIRIGFSTYGSSLTSVSGENYDTLSPARSPLTAVANACAHGCTPTSLGSNLRAPEDGVKNIICLSSCTSLLHELWPSTLIADVMSSAPWPVELNPRRAIM